MAAFPPTRPISVAAGRPAKVKGFGCRPVVAIRALSVGRRPKASQEGTSGKVKGKVKGFGCRPVVAIRALSEGRRPKASQEGTRGALGGRLPFMGI
jgi:hypothetical protein